MKITCPQWGGIQSGDEHHHWQQFALPDPVAKAAEIRGTDDIGDACDRCGKSRQKAMFDTLPTSDLTKIVIIELVLRMFRIVDPKFPEKQSQKRQHYAHRTKQTFFNIQF